MKKLSILIGLVFFGLATTTAQTFEKGDNVANLTVGFGPGNNSGAGYTSGIAFGLSVEHCFWDDLINGDFSIGIGGYLGYSGSKYEVPGFSVKYTYFAPAGRGTFHWTAVDQLDLYAGLHLGYQIVSSEVTGNLPIFGEPVSSGSLYQAAFVGARYYFTDAFGVCAELGSGLAFLNVGATLKF